MWSNSGTGVSLAHPDNTDSRNLTRDLLFVWLCASESWAPPARPLPRILALFTGRPAIHL